MPKYTYSSRVGEALKFAANLHASQRRKGEGGAAYLGHLLGVCSAVIERKADEDTIIAAVLHDAIEDRPNNGLTEKQIQVSFGDKVLSLIKEVTHPPCDKTKTPVELTDAYIECLKTMSLSAILIAIHDKIYNISSIITELNCGDIEVLDKYKGGVEGVIYKYTNISKTIRLRILDEQPNMTTKDFAHLWIDVNSLLKCTNELLERIQVVKDSK